MVLLKSSLLLSDWMRQRRVRKCLHPSVSFRVQITTLNSAVKQLKSHNNCVGSNVR